MAIAALLPMARAVFYDASGNPLANGLVHTYVPGGTTPKTTWQDAAETIPNLNPVVLDSAGSCLLYGSGHYTLAVTDALGNAVPGYSGDTLAWPISDALAPFVGAPDTATAVAALGLITSADLANQVDASKGSALVGYFRPGAGWVGRTVAARLNDYVSFLDFGADPSGVGDSTNAIQAGINYVAARGGGMLWGSAGTYNITGTLSIANDGVILQGASEYSTILVFANGAANCISVSNSHGAMIRDMSIVGSGKTGGNGIVAANVRNCVFSDLSMRNMALGIEISQLNNCTLQNIEILISAAVGGGGWGIHWHSTAATRSDVLTMRDVVVNAFGHGQIGMLVDGMCQTLRIDNCGMIHCSIGLFVRNTLGDASNFPQFFYVNDLEIDGVDVSSVSITAGREMHFVHLDCFNAGGAGADQNCLTLLSDGAVTVTNLLTFTACRFAGARARAVSCSAKMVDFIGCYFGDNSVAGLNAFPAIEFFNDGGVNGAAVGVNIIGGRMQAFGDLANMSYGLVVDAGCSRITVTNVDFSNCNLGAILDNTGAPGNVDWQGCDDINGTPLPDRMPVVSVDPTILYEGMIWENVTSHTLKVYLNGTIKTITAV